MANYSGNVTSFTQTPLYEDLEDTIRYIGWEQAKLFARLPRVADATQIKHEWVEDEIMPFKDTIAGAQTTSVTTITMTNAYRFRKYEIIKLGAHYYKVTTLGSAGKTLGVSAVNTVSAAYSASTPVFGLGVGQFEGTSPQTGIQTTPSRVFNWCETFEDKLTITDIRDAVAAPGSPEGRRQYRKKLKEHAQEINMALLYGYRSPGTGSAAQTLAYYTGGLVPWITTANVYSCGGSTTSAITEAKFEEYLAKIFDNGATPRLLVCNSTGMRALNTWYRSYYKIDNQISGAIGIKTTRVVSSFGDVEVLVEPQLDNTGVTKASYDKASGEILVLDTARLGLSYLQKIGTTRRIPLARTGSASNEMLRTIVTLVRKNPGAHVRIHSFALGS